MFAQQGPGGVLLTDPQPGTLRTLAQTFFTGPRFFKREVRWRRTSRSPNVTG
jgi:hypothetical protein